MCTFWKFRRNDSNYPICTGTGKLDFTGRLVEFRISRMQMLPYADFWHVIYTFSVWRKFDEKKNNFLRISKFLQNFAKIIGSQSGGWGQYCGAGTFWSEPVWGPVPATPKIKTEEILKYVFSPFVPTLIKCLLKKLSVIL